MDTQDPSTKKIPALRTYAKDLEYTRTEKNLPLHHRSEVVVEKTIPQPKSPGPSIKEVPPPTKKESAPEIEIKQIIKNDPIKISDLNTKNTAFLSDNDDAGAATIITDTKKDRFKLFPAILSSLTNWFSNKKRDRKRKAVPKYSVPNSSHRKGLIQKATSTTGKSVASDFSSMPERIRQRAEPEEKRELHQIWTPDTEPGYFLLEEPESIPEASVSNVQMTPRKSITTEIEVEDEIEDEIETWGAPDTTALISSNPEKSFTDQKEIAAQEDFYSKPTVENLESAAVPNNNLAEIPEATNYQPEPPVPRERLIPLKKVPPKKESFIGRLKILALDTNTLALFIAGFVLVLIIIIFSITYLLDLNNKVETVVIDPTSVSLLLNTRVELIAVENPATDILSVLKNEERKQTGFQQFAFVNNLLTNQLLTPTTIFSVLKNPLEANFLQTIRDVRFGFTKDGQPFILLSIGDREVAKGGLLAWEDTAYPDVLGMFGLAAAPQSTLGKFTDSAFSGRDVRIMKNENNSELLLYGIINQTVIITTSSVGFRELSILIK